MSDRFLETLAKFVRTPDGDGLSVIVVDIG
jgi:hypothetical protein